MKPVRHVHIPSRFKRTGMLFLRGLLNTGCRRQAFKHALLDAGKADSSSPEASLEQDPKEVKK